MEGLATKSAAMANTSCPSDAMGRGRLDEWMGRLCVQRWLCCILVARSARYSPRHERYLGSTHSAQAELGKWVATVAVGTKVTLPTPAHS